MPSSKMTRGRGTLADAVNILYSEILIVCKAGGGGGNRG